MARKATGTEKAKPTAKVVRLADIKERGANKAHVPTSETRIVVTALAIQGIAQDRIAEHIEVSKPTLLKHYRSELTLGKERMITRVIANIFAIATQRQDMKASLTASIFILKTQGGWREKEREEENSNEERREVVVSLNIGDKEPKRA